MCKSPLHPFLAALPKCEHHIHVEGTLSTKLLFELAAVNNITLPSSDPAFESAASLSKRYDDFKSLDDFLHYYFIGMSVLITSSDFERLAYEYYERAAADGVHHAEVFFDPEAHMSRGVEYGTIIAGLTAAKARAEKTLKISTDFILCVLRHLPVPSAVLMFDTALAANHFADGTLIGLGLSSTEQNNPPQKYAEIYAKAKANSIRRTAHFGEEGPPAYIAGAIDDLYSERIDHGRRLAEDKALMARVASEGILLTLCPISNVCLQGVKRMEDMPIREFIDAGVKFSINSDDPAYFGGYLLENYCAVQEAFQLSVAEWATIATNAVNGSWCEEGRKKEILQDVEKCVKEFEGIRD